MMIPLFVLAAGAVFAGVIFAPYFIGAHAHDFWRDVIMLPGGGHGAAAAEGHGEGGHHVPDWVAWAPFAVTLSGFLLALPIYFFSQTMGAAIARATGPVHAFLYNKWYFDELYDLVFVKGARAIGDLFWKVGDRRVIDGLGPNGIAWLAKFGGRQLRRVQTGFVYHYSFLMLVAVVAFGAYALWSAGALPK
jgi:NADH-quinone oxidoreductase subunit L